MIQNRTMKLIAFSVFLQIFIAKVFIATVKHFIRFSFRSSVIETNKTRAILNHKISKIFFSIYKNVKPKRKSKTES